MVSSLDMMASNAEHALDKLARLRGESDKIRQESDRLDAERLAAVHAAREAGATLQEIADTLDVTRQAVHYMLQR